MGNSIFELGFGALVHHNGGDTNAQLNRAVSQVSLDCMERPGESKPRSITIKLIFEPVVDQDGYVTDNEMYVEIGNKIPGYKSKKTSVTMRKRGNQGTFVFSEDTCNDEDNQSLGRSDDDDE